MYRFADRAGLSSDQVWAQLLKSSTDAVSHLVSFLEVYIASATKCQVCLGPEESEEVRTIEHAVTLQDAWAALVHVADKKIMEPKRLQNPDEAHIYVLKYSTRGGRVTGPTGLVGQVRCL